MEEFLRKLGLSEESIKIYITSLGKSILSYYELKSIMPELNEENFNENINNLLNLGLLIQSNLEKDVILTEFLAIPPYNPILNYFKNIETSFSEIRNSIDDLIIKSINETFIKESNIEYKSISKKYEEIRKDFIEDSLLQKKDAEDISKQMGAMSKVGEFILNIDNMMNTISKAEFNNLIKTFNKLKDELKEKIESLEIKKKKQEILNEIIEETFKSRLNSVIKDFLGKIITSVKEEMSKIQLQKKIENSINSQDDFKMLLLNLINNFELNMKKLAELIDDKENSLEQNINKLKNRFISKICTIVQKSIKEIENLNKPIINLISESKLIATSVKDLKKNNVCPINSVAKIKKEIINAIKNSKEELMIIIPKLEDYLQLEYFKNIPKSIRIRIASSDPHVNSRVKKFKEISNLEFKNYENTNFIGIKSDNKAIGIGIIKSDNQDPLNNVIGFFSENVILNNKLESALYNIWSSAENQIGKVIKEKPTYISSKTSEIKTMPSINKKKVSKIESPIVSKIPEIPKKVGKKNKKVRAIPIQAIENGESEKELLIFISKVNPKAGDSVGMIINNAFNTIIQNFNSFTGEFLTQELEKVADIILERRGFSVTLHDIRRSINNYKNQTTLLTIEQKNDIFHTIENWKQRLFL